MYIYCRIRCCCTVSDVAHHAIKDTVKIFFFIIVIILTEAKLNFYSQEKNDDLIFSDFRYFHFTKKAEHF